MYGEKIPIMKPVEPAEKVENKPTVTSSNPRFRRSAFGYEKGEVVLAKNAKVYPYLSVKCENGNLIGTIDGELPIDPRSPKVRIGQEVEFELSKDTSGDKVTWYAFIRVVKWR